MGCDKVNNQTSREQTAAGTPGGVAGDRTESEVAQFL